MEKILIIDDDVTLSVMLRTWLGKRGFEVDTAADLATGRKLLGAGDYALILSDMRLPDGEGTDLLQWTAEHAAATPVIVMTGYAEIGNAVNSMKLGARDYISKPVRPDELLRKIREAIDSAGEAAPVAAPAPSARKGTKERSPLRQEGALSYVEGRSEASRKLYEFAELVAPTNMSVLIEGASGTGKEHIARLIHEHSKRAGKPFVAVDCGALSRDLAASEFFGHIKGSFTGALADKKGAFEVAHGGTLFLDEVGNLSYDIQVQLLRALQERRIRPVGGARELSVDIRLICATNEDLEGAIVRGSFRADLYHRIDEFVLRMPDLAERQEDIMLYANFFLEQANRDLDKQVAGFDPEAEKLLLAYDWPGNLRQLKNTVTRSTLMARGRYVTPADLPIELTGAEPAAPASVSLRDPAGEEERIRRALSAAGGNKSQAARLLGVDRKTLYNKLHLYGIE
ncbi:MAG: sigma-54 dependent transcriptional regulator [Alistipes sp.]|nr:sigma-54 dependent transcriptional regulator [Alistipes sp.]